MRATVLMARCLLAAPPRLLGVLSCAALIALLQACAADKPAVAKVSYVIKEEPSAGFFLPKGAFAKPPAPKPTESGASKDKPSEVKQTEIKATIIPMPTSSESPVPFSSEVLLYASPSTQAYFETGELDASESKVAWETFLKKYQIPYKVLATLSQLERSRSGVLILPSSVALSKKEQQAVLDFRARGGSVLASWLCGVRDEKGVWLGFGFMEGVLDVKVVGDTSTDKDDNFLMPHGDSPISNYLPAGQRIWLERAKQWPTLRLTGRFAAAHIMDWSRTFAIQKATTAITFDERVLDSKRTSRSVVLGYPERLWRTADPKHLEAIAHNALTWLRRLPSAYSAAWPAPYSSALLLAVDAAENIVEADLTLAKYLEDIGARATFYTLGDNAAKSAVNLKALQSRGHELAFMGDKFAGFRGQAIATQATRLDNMLARAKDAGLSVPANPGFHAPTESYDKNTEVLLLQKGFGHYIAFMDATDARLPFSVRSSQASAIAAASANAAATAAAVATSTPTSTSNNSTAPTTNSETTDASSLTTIVLPRTQRGPEDATEEGDYEDGIKSFFAEIALVEKMAGLSVIRMPNQGLLTIDQMAEIVDELKTRRERTWMATASQIAAWWRERERVTVRLEGEADAPILTMEIQGTEPIKEAVTIWVNLPTSGQTVRLIPVVPGGPAESMPTVTTVDHWRAGLLVSGLAPGSHRWQVQFVRASDAPKK
jgi:hypothetical protein